MLPHLRANLWLLALTLGLCSCLYPLGLWAVGETVFPEQAHGSLLNSDGHVVGSRLLAQPFSADEYFHPRPSAASYNGAASGASNWAANNYLLRDRVARQLGPVVRYRSGPQAGQLVGPDIEDWFQRDRYQGRAGLVAHWAKLHPVVAQNWVKADKLNAGYVASWQKSHTAEVTEWQKARRDMSEPQPEDLAGPFFASYSREHPGTFPGAVERISDNGQRTKVLAPVRQGRDIQALFFDLWLQEHPALDLEPVPADLVMASGSGLDPHITLANALWQLDRVAAAWATRNHLSRTQTTQQIEQLLRARSHAPLGGLVGVPLVNVLEVNLALRERFQSDAPGE